MDGILRSILGETMITLPFMDIPVVEIKTPPLEERKEALDQWAEGDTIRLSVCFLSYTNEGDSIEDYFFQIGFIHKGNIVTTTEVIEEMGNSLYPIAKWKEYNVLLPRLRNHLSLYFDKIGAIPSWGANKFYELKAQGRVV